MKIIQRAILENAVRWCTNILVEAFSSAQLEDGEARAHMKKALEELQLAGLKLRLK